MKNAGEEKRTGVPEMALRSACEFAEIARGILPDSSIYLFGSQAKGCATEASDIDIAVLCEDLGGLDVEDYLSVRRRIFVTADEVDPMIEPHLISCSHEHSGFLETILETGILIAGPIVDR